MPTTNKTIYYKPTTNILNDKRLKAFPLRSGSKTRVIILITPIQHSTRNRS